MTRIIYFFLYLLWTAFPMTAHMEGIAADTPRTSASYWLDRLPAADSLIADDIPAYTARLTAASPSVIDLAAYPPTLSRQEAARLIGSSDILDRDWYAKGRLLTKEEKEQIAAELNLAALPETVPVRYAVAVTRANLRTLPIREGLFTSPNDTDFDRMQETVLDPGEPVLLLHESLHQTFYYIQARNYRGWLSAADIGITSRENWQRFAAPRQFLTVIGKEYLVSAGGLSQRYQQGSVLLLLSQDDRTYTVQLPWRNADGQLERIQTVIPKNPELLHEGYLPYTSRTILESAFRFYGSPYGWGGLKNSVDCSSLVFNAYRTAGIYLPRNADEQEAAAGHSISFAGMSREERLQAIASLPPGTPVFMDGHVLLFLGMQQDRPYFIHSLAYYYDRTGALQRAMAVVVSDTDLYRANGEDFLDAFTSAVIFK